MEPNLARKKGVVKHVRCMETFAIFASIVVRRNVEDCDPFRKLSFPFVTHAKRCGFFLFNNMRAKLQHGLHVVKHKCQTEIGLHVV